MISLRTARPPVLLTRAASVVLLLLGLAADIWAGSAVLAGDAAVGLATHLPAALAWGVGLGYLSRPVGWQGPFLTGRAITGLLLGLLLFPGLGALGYGIPALLLALWRHLRLPTGSPPRPLPAIEDIPPPTAGESFPDSATLLRALQVQPLVEILREADVERKRVVIGMLGRDARRDAVSLLRGLLVDPHPDVRSDASVELTRLEDEIGRQLGQAVTRAQASPDDPLAQRELVRQQLRYARSGLLDGPSARYYLFQARDTLLLAATLDPAAENDWREFAGACRDLDDREGLQEALDALRRLGISSEEEAVLEIEIAYADRDWARLSTLTHEYPLEEQADMTGALLDVWTGPDPVVRNGTA